MKPTTEQVAQWAREVNAERFANGVWAMFADELESLVAKACAWQAEQDAKLCERVYGPTDWTVGHSVVKQCAAAIRANAPKGETT